MQVQDGSAPPDDVTIWVVGDSTVSEFHDDYYYPRYGWGTMLKRYFKDVDIKNLAISGTSSLSFTNSDNYKYLITNIKKGDFLLIGFGHNDEKTELSRYTDPNGDINENGSFENVLFKKYIKVARAVGATPILCTPIVRRNVNNDYTGDSGHITKMQFVEGTLYNGGNYPESIRRLGKKENVQVIDLTKLTKLRNEKLGPEKSKIFQAQTSSNDISIDNTHTNIYGAAYNAYLLAKEIQKSNSDLKDYLKDSIKKPNKKMLSVNSKYKEHEYSSPINISKIWPSNTEWKGTVFGNVGGDENINKENFSLNILSDKTINMRAGKFLEEQKGIGIGKISSTNDGVAMYYQQISADKNFILSADVTINNLILNNQVSYGLMVRDDMYIDKSINDTLGDYVVAGPLGLASTSQTNCFARKSGVLIKGGICNKVYKIGDTVHLEIKKTSDGYSCTYGKNPTISAGFDFSLTNIDPKYVYAGLFVSRNADVTFKNIKLKILN